jgi:hypothetical protein
VTSLRHIGVHKSVVHDVVPRAHPRERALRASGGWESERVERVREREIDLYLSISIYNNRFCFIVRERARRAPAFSLPPRARDGVDVMLMWVCGRHACMNCMQIFGDWVMSGCTVGET